MAIVTQAAFTSLRSLKYGSDQPGGGNSGEPYITQKIPPAFQQQVPSTNIWLSDSGLIRGGFAGATRASGLDTLRIGKFLTDPPRGPLFIAKQVGLQLSNPKLETRSDLLGQLAGKIGSTRIYNLGINTLAQIPVNAFGGHIVRHGLFPILNEGTTYARVVVANDAEGTFGADNRLVQLKTKLEAARDLTSLIPITNYVGGPGSIDGIGSTIIRRFDNTLGNTPYTPNISFFLPGTTRQVRISRYPRPNPTVDYFKAQGVSEEYFANENGNPNLGEIEVYNDIISGSLTSVPSQINQNVIDYPASGRTYNRLKSAIDTQTNNNRVGTANIVLNPPNSTTKDGTINNSSQVSSPITFTYTGKAYGGKTKNLDLGFYNIENRIGLSNRAEPDQINVTPVYLDQRPPGAVLYVNGVERKVRDLIKFRIEAVEGNDPNYSAWMIFRAYLKDISDNHSPSWNTINYVGRGEPFYIYQGFERNISFNFQVAAMSEAELQPMWQKLNYLYSNTMPDYDGNVMRGPFMKLTIGNYLYRQPGIIKSLTYTIGNDSPWEIALTGTEGRGNLYELPHVMNVSMTFAPVHDFLPRKFPTQNTESSDLLPAFVVDRQTDNNRWLNNIYNANNNTSIATANDGSNEPGLFRNDIEAPIEV